MLGRILAAAVVVFSSACTRAAPVPARGYHMRAVVKGSGFHTLDGIVLPDVDHLLAASASSGSIYSWDRRTGKVTTYVGPPKGESDDLVLGGDNSLYWTAIIEGVIRVRRADGRIEDIAHDIPGANSLALSRDGRRLFVGQVFLGDGLWEVDSTGQRAPRMILTDIGGLNAFSIGADGMIYGPLWFKHTVVRIGPDSGTITTLARDLGSPGAVRIEAQGQIYVLDDATGTIYRIDPAIGAKARIATLRSATDNRIFEPNGDLLVSNMADNSITEVDPRTGGARLLISGALAFPKALAFGGPGDQALFVADTTAVRRVDLRTGSVTDLSRRIATNLGLPGSVSLTADRIVVTDDSLGHIQLLDRGDGRIILTMGKLDRPLSGIMLHDGRVVVAEPLHGRVMQTLNGDTVPILTGLNMPTALADLGDGRLIIGEAGSGTLSERDMKTH